MDLSASVTTSRVIIKNRRARRYLDLAAVVESPYT